MEQFLDTYRALPFDEQINSCIELLNNVSPLVRSVCSEYLTFKCRIDGLEGDDDEVNEPDNAFESDGDESFDCDEDDISGSSEFDDFNGNSDDECGSNDSEGELT